MEFAIDTADRLNITDHELSELLTQVYVSGGFVKPAEATALFDPSAVRNRGLLIGARDEPTSNLAGVVILVPPESPARRVAQGNEVEMHLLGVKEEYRRRGLGRLLVEAAVSRAKNCNYPKMVLVTQLSMESAHKLYETTGFAHVNDIQRNGRDFRVYALAL